MENIVPVCTPCNQRKGSRTLSAFLGFYEAKEFIRNHNKLISQKFTAELLKPTNRLKQMNGNLSDKEKQANFERNTFRTWRERR